MPYLGDYLGHLLSEITIARVQADLESVRVAELYASHPLLRHFPVPHLRLPTITLDVSVVVKDMEEAKPGESPRGGLALPPVRERFAYLLGMHLERARIVLSDTQKASLDRALDQSTSRAAPPPYVSISAIQIADELVYTTIKALGGADGTKSGVEPLQLEKLAVELKAAARSEFTNLRATPPRLLVLVTTAELREAGPKELLTQLHLSISEEGLEWAEIESQGKSNARLVPE